MVIWAEDRARCGEVALPAKAGLDTSTRPGSQKIPLAGHKTNWQAVLVDQGLPGEITAVKRGTVRGVLDLPPLNTWLYTVKPEASGDPQTDVPEYNVVAQADQGESSV